MENKRNLKIVGYRLQYFRQQKGMKQEYIAKCLRLSKSSISKIENGNYNLKLLTAIKYCQIISIPIAFILENLYIE